MVKAKRIERDSNFSQFIIIYFFIAFISILVKTLRGCLLTDKINGCVVEWLTCQTSNLRIASRMGSSPVLVKNCYYLEQESSYSLLSTGWFQELIRGCFYQLKLST